MREDLVPNKHEFKASTDNIKYIREFVDEIKAPVNINENNDQVNVIDEDDFKNIYLTEQLMNKIAIDFIAIAWYRYTSFSQLRKIFNRRRNGQTSISTDNCDRRHASRYCDNVRT